MKKAFMKRHLLTTACISTLIFSSTAPVWAACSNSSLKGDYAYSEQGSTLFGSQAIPIAEVGIISADGSSPVGHFTITATANWGNQSIGVQMPLKIVFTTDGPDEGYKVQPDCTGTVTFSVTAYDAMGNIFIPKTSGRTAAFVVNKDKIQWIVTSQGTVVSGTGEKK